MIAELKNELGVVYFTTEKVQSEKWVHNEWIGYITVEDLKKAALKGLDVLIESKFSKLLNSNAKLEGSWDEANEWIGTVWMPQALAAGLKYFAHIVSPDIFGALSSEQLEVNLKEAGFVQKTFDNYQDAENWLRSVE